MAVHDVGGGTAVVSFLEITGGTGAQAVDARVFIVDVWKQLGASWKLAIRYASPVGQPDGSTPQAADTPAAPPRH
jgi:hypothetical protein